MANNKKILAYANNKYKNHLFETKDSIGTVELIINKYAKTTARDVINGIFRYCTEIINMKHDDFHVQIDALKASFMDKSDDVLSKLELYKNQTAYQCWKDVKGFHKGISITGDNDIDKSIVQIPIVPDFLASFRVPDHLYDEVNKKSIENRTNNTMHKAPREIKMSEDEMIQITETALIEKLNQIEENPHDTNLCTDLCFELVGELCILTGRRPNEILQEDKFEYMSHPDKDYILKVRGLAKKRVYIEEHVDIPTLIPTASIIKSLEYIYQYITDPLIKNGPKTTNNFANKYNERVREILGGEFTASDARSAYSKAAFKKRKMTNYYPDCDSEYLYAKEALKHEGEPGPTSHYVDVKFIIKKDE